MSTFFTLSATLSSPAVMGILNVTPDSFSDGGHFVTSDAACGHALAMVEAGASIIDVGGESTRPGADPVSEQQELDRIIPVIERLAAETEALISVDTSKAGVMAAAVAAGAGMINDVCALRGDGALATAASLNVPVCLMHMQGEPRTMQNAPDYDDVVAAVVSFLRQRVDSCMEAGIRREHICVDPGFGFGKSVAHNLALLRSLDAITALGLPVLVGLSRKSMIGKILNRDVGQRMNGSVVLAALAIERGASIVRVHDVEQTAEAVQLVSAVLGTA